MRLEIETSLLIVYQPLLYSFFCGSTGSQLFVPSEVCLETASILSKTTDTSTSLSGIKKLALVSPVRSVLTLLSPAVTATDLKS